MDGDPPQGGNFENVPINISYNGGCRTVFGAQFFANKYLDHIESRYEISFGYLQQWGCCGWLKNFEIGGLMFLKLSRYLRGIPRYLARKFWQDGTSGKMMSILSQIWHGV